MSTNYTIWRMRMEVLLGIHGVWDVVDPALRSNVISLGQATISGYDISIR
ncbi:initiator tRNA phosphoribosyl transferase, partial [Tanacetum coccineum]